MPETRDPKQRVNKKQGPFHHVCAGIHIGSVAPQPKAGEFDSVLTLALDPRSVDDSIRHRHIHLSRDNLQRRALDQAVDWACTQFAANRSILIRSEGGKQRPGLVAAATLVRMGATFLEALSCVRQADPLALSDVTFTSMLRIYTDPTETADA